MADRRIKMATVKKANSAFMKPMKISAELAVIVGTGPMPRSEVVQKMWVYIKKHGLQDAKNKRMINADAKLGVLFGGAKQVSMFQLAGLIGKHAK
jgi:upstream activation factor subunit UAF30